MNRLGAVVTLLVVVSVVASAQPQVSDQQVYERFREWASQQQTEANRQTAQAAGAPDLLTRYREELRSRGVTASEIDRQIRVIQEQGQRLEIERWNRILTNPKPTFNTEPNAFLVQIAKSRKPGTALDVGMGQGRNAIYLAQQGWTVTGFDPADQAVAAARDRAQRLGLKVTTVVADDDHFDWGRDRWDLILLSYVGAREMAADVINSLRPGGVVVIEAFHRDATKTASIGGGVVFDTNELLRLFENLRVIHYEDVAAVADFGSGMTRVVRLAAEKPQSRE
jgi:SAM-dependent methyltransferase